MYVCESRVCERKMGSPAVLSRHILTCTSAAVACLLVSSILILFDNILCSPLICCFVHLRQFPMQDVASCCQLIRNVKKASFQSFHWQEARVNRGLMVVTAQNSGDLHEEKHNS